MPKKLFVGGLAWATTDEALRGAFERFGAVKEAVVVMDRDSGRSRGFGFVTFVNDGDAVQAQQEMDGSQLDGRRINVNEANERKPREGGFGGGGGGYREARGGYGGGGGGYGSGRERW
jgi:RNA recognition motif-containing protein